MRKDEVFSTVRILNSLLGDSDQTNSPERAAAAGRYAEMIREINREIERRRRLLAAGERSLAVRYEPDETPLPELFSCLRLSDELRYRRLCELYGWPLPPRPDVERAKLLMDPEDDNCLSLPDLLNRWHAEAAILPLKEKLLLLRQIRRLDVAHARHWERLLPELEKEYCASLFAQAEAARDEAELAPVVRELLTADWVSAVPAAGRERAVAKLHDLQTAELEERRQKIFHDLADGASRREKKRLEEALTALAALMSDPDCRLDESESRQKIEAEQLVEKLDREEACERRAAALSEKIGDALDEGAPYPQIEADYRALRECGTIIEVQLDRRVQSALRTFREAENRKFRSRLICLFAITAIVLAAAGAAVYWYQLERRLEEMLAVTAAFLEKDSPRLADEQLKSFFYRHPGLAARSRVVQLRHQTDDALRQAEQRAAEFDRRMTAWERAGGQRLTEAEAIRFRQQEAALKKLPPSDDVRRRQRYEAVAEIVAGVEKDALRQREKRHLALCDRILKQLLAEQLTAAEEQAVARHLAALERLPVPLTPLEQSAVKNCRKQLTARQQRRQEEAAYRTLLHDLAAPVSAEAYLSHLAVLRTMPTTPEGAVWRRSTDPWYETWSRCCAYRLREPAFTGDREADELIRQIRAMFPDRMVRQILPRLFPAGKLAGEPILKRFSNEVEKWEKETAAAPGRELYELVLLGPHRERCHFFGAEPPEIERSGHGRNRLLALRLKAQASADRKQVETLTFCWRYEPGKTPVPERIGPTPRLPEFRRLPLSFAGVADTPNVTDFVPRQASQLRFARETVSRLKKAADRDEAGKILEERLQLLAGQVQMEPLFRLQLAGRLLDLLTTVESLYEPYAHLFHQQMTKTVPAEWNPYSPVMALDQPRTAAAMTSLLSQDACRQMIQTIARQRERERLTWRRFPRPAGVMVPMADGRPRFVWFSGQTPEAELWQLEKDPQGGYGFRIVKRFGREHPVAATVPAGTLLFTPADDRPTPPPVDLPVQPLCWPLPEAMP